jgi:hypothetical protein
MERLRPFYEEPRKVLLMFKIRIERHTQWQATAAFFCFVTSIFGGIVGSVLTTSAVLNAQLHPLLHAIGLTLLIIAIPVLILGGHFLDLMERKQKELRDDDAHREMRDGRLHTVALIGFLCLFFISPAKLEAQPSATQTVLEKGASPVAPLAEESSSQAQETPASEEQETPPSNPKWQYGGFVDSAYLLDFNHPANHLFRSRGTAFRVDNVWLNMAAIYLRKKPSEDSRWGVEITAQAGKDAELFGFSATAPNIAGYKFLRQLGPTNVSYLTPVGRGLTLQAGIFSSLIGYDSLYAKDNLNYTRPWGADFTPYLMLGANASYPFTEKLTGTFFVVNGYWHLARANSAPSAGGQVAYKLTPRVTLKETTLFGPHQRNTSFKFWRFLTDTIVERKTPKFTFAFEYIFSTERVDAPGKPRALMMAWQLPSRWTINDRWSLSFRPEVFWDRDGRWTLARQTVKAFTSTLEYRIPYRWTTSIFRLEHRFDDSRGPDGGFFRGREISPGVVGLTPSQHLLIFATIFTLDSPAPK